MQTYNANLKPEIKENITQKKAAKKQAQVTPTGLMSRPSRPVMPKFSVQKK